MIQNQAGVRGQDSEDVILDARVPLALGVPPVLILSLAFRHLIESPRRPPMDTTTGTLIRVGPGDYSPRPPTDLGVRDYRTQFFESRFCCAAEP
jgi:hypothetical protein